MSRPLLRDGDGRPEETAAPQAPVETPTRRIVFCLGHSGHLRVYRSAIEVLLARGHEIHVAVSRPEKDAGDDRILAEFAAHHASVSWGIAADRDPDPWRDLATSVRALTDLARYLHPAYDDAPRLRRRTRRKVLAKIGGKRRDPVSRYLARRLAARVSRPGNLRTCRRYVRLFSWIEEAIPASPRVGEWLRGLRPDAVLVTPVVDVASPQVEIVKSARKRGVPCAICVASWDNLTNRGLLRVRPDRVIVWNEIQRREAVEMHSIPADDVVVTGAQRFDEWFERRPSSSREEFTARVGLDAGRPFVVYLCSSFFVGPEEAAFVTRWLEALRGSSDPRLQGIGVLIRPHPQNIAQWQAVDVSRFGNVSIWPREGAQPDAGEARAVFFDSLYHAEVAVGINTSALIEAGIVGKRVLTVLADEFAETQEGTLHFHYLREDRGGFLHVARTLDEHLDDLAALLATDAGARQADRRFIESFVRPNGIDVRAADVFAGAVEDLAGLPMRPQRTPSWTHPLRLALQGYSRLWHGTARALGGARRVRAGFGDGSSG